MPKNTVLLTTRAPIGYVAITENQLSTNQGFKSFLPSSFYVPKYLFWYLKGNTELLVCNASGTTFLELSKTRTAQIPFPLPPLHEQQRIVNIIESLFKNLDEAKEKLLEVKKGFGERKAALLHKAFTGELTAKWRERNGVGLDSWEEKRVDEIGEIITGSTPNTKKREYYDGDIPFIKPTELNQGRHIINS